MHLSIVIPAYNEEQRIFESLRQICAYLTKQSYESEVIVVDDGSTDKTVQIVQTDFPVVRVISYHPNRGKGFAVKTGMMAAQGDYRVFYDADASTPIGEIEKFWPKFESGADIVIGSRSLPDSDVAVHQPWYRENMGRSFNLVLRMLRLTHFPDTQCGFKAYTAAACKVVFTRQTVERFGFDAENLFIAETHGLRVEQVPIRWLNSPLTRVNAVVDSARIFYDTFGIRINQFRGRYR